MKHFLTCTLCLFFSAIPLRGFSQTQLSISSFPNAIQLYNPSYVGFSDNINVLVLNKSQWVNAPGGPTLQGISGHMPISYDRLGIGLNLLKESTSTLQSLYVNANASYKINFQRGRLAFGIRLGMLQRKETLDGLLVKDKDDALLNNSNQLLPEVGGGFFYKQRNFYTGLSFTRSAGIYLSNDASLKNYYHLIGGYTKQLSARVDLLPAAHIKYTTGFDPYAALLVPVSYNNLFSVGLGYSTASVFSAVATLNIDKAIGTTANKYVISYAYDQSFNKLTNYIGNTHEVMLVIKFVPAEKADRILKRKVTVSPLFFD